MKSRMLPRTEKKSSYRTKYNSETIVSVLEMDLSMVDDLKKMRVDEATFKRRTKVFPILEKLFNALYVTSPNTHYTGIHEGFSDILEEYVPPFTFNE